VKKTRIVERGERFGRLTIIEPEVYKVLPSVPNGIRAADCRCDCGTLLRVSIGQLFRQPGTRSCGCGKRRRAADRWRSHGLHDHPLYATHKAMMQRCYRPDHHAYAYYGGRGIEVCDRWHDVRLFIEDIERDLGPRPDGMTLDRINNNGNYEPGNVRWATHSEQTLNQRPRRRAT
jgi:hypothetical protein